MKGYWRSGDPFVWLTGGALAVGLILILGLIGLILVQGFGFFWPDDVERIALDDGRVVQGQVTDHENAQLQVKQGNRDVYGVDFVWIEDAKIRSREKPQDLVVFERLEWGNLYATILDVRDGDRVVATGAEAWSVMEARLPETRRLQKEIRRIAESDIGAVAHAQERIRLQLRALEMKGLPPDPELVRENAEWQAKFEALMTRMNALKAKLTWSATVEVAGGQTLTLPLAQVVRMYRPNRMGTFAKLGFYFEGLWGFLSDDPRESNTEGGIFPAIFGTVLMVLLMSLFVTPLGILAALYLREYAKQGPLVSAVRIAVNNLAGVPSIVFGVFGVGFFIYRVGGGIDRWLYPEALPTPTYGTGGILWASLTLALLTVPVVIVATEEGLAAIPKGLREASLALGATKFETTWRVVLPSLLPSILTGLILAMARAAGEVAPLMLTGVVKLAPQLPVDSYAPYVHLDRKFMHLGFHIYDVGFQSPNIDAARPMVFATTMLLILIVVFLNLAAIVLRRRLRKRFATSAV